MSKFKTCPRSMIHILYMTTHFTQNFADLQLLTFMKHKGIYQMMTLLCGNVLFLPPFYTHTHPHDFAILKSPFHTKKYAGWLLRFLAESPPWFSGLCRRASR